MVYSIFPFISSCVDRRGFTRYYWVLVLRGFTKEKTLNVERHPIFIPFKFHFDINHSFILESRCDAYDRHFIRLCWADVTGRVIAVVPAASCKVSLQYWQPCCSSKCHIPKRAMLQLHVILKVVLTSLLGHRTYFMVFLFLSDRIINL